MGKLTIQISDELESRLRNVQDQIEEILELGLRELEPTLSPYYEDVVVFLANGPSTSEIANFRASEKRQQRVRDLLDKNREGQLSEGENAELDLIQSTNHFMTLIKSKARRLSNQSS